MSKYAHATISDSNVKMGETPSYSLPPIVTCPKGVPCTRDCYATQGTFQFDAVQASYARNLYFLEKCPEVVQAEIEAYVTRKALEYFRWNVSGDFYSPEYFTLAVEVARACPDTKFLAFTKQYAIVNAWLDHDSFPENFAVVFSYWEGYDCPNPHGLPTSIVIDEASALPQGFTLCPGKCEICQASKVGCWHAGKGEGVAFIKHGQRVHMDDAKIEANFLKFVAKLNKALDAYDLR